MVATQGAGPLIAGIEPSQGLTFAPLAGTQDFGRSWVTGILPSALAQVPDALTTTPAGAVLALVRQGGGAIQTGSIQLAGWRSTTTRTALSATPGGRRCGVSTLSALSTLGGAPFVGVSCARRGILGLFTYFGGIWHLVSTGLPSPRAPATVLRLGTSNGATFSLVRVGGARPFLVVLWMVGGVWSHSPPLAIGAGERIEATSTGSGALAVTLDGDRGGSIVELATAGGPWHSAPSPPKGTVIVVPGAGSALSALSVSSSTLTGWQLASGTTMWVPVQRIVVPLAYGSSQ